MKREGSLQRSLCKLKQKKIFNEIEYDKLYPYGSAPDHIYGTPKVQKFSSSDSFPKLPQVVLSIRTFNYNLARFLCDLLFLLFLKLRMQIFPKKFLGSHDVTSIFTNIPLQETFDIAINVIFNHNPNLNITRKEFKKLFPFCYITDSFYI